MRVLVVDDEPEMRRIVRRSLERAGFDVVDAGDADAALRLTRLESVDVAVLDLHLPGMSGLELMAALREGDPGLPVIMLSGSGGEADRVRGLVSGADDYVGKPFSAAELAARVTAAGRRRAPPDRINGHPVGDTSRLRELATGIQSEVADAVIITDVRLRIQSFNPAAEVLYGWREEEIVGRSMLDVLPWVTEPATYERVRSDFERDGRWHGEIVQRRRDGSLVTVGSSATLLRDKQGQPVGIVTVNRPAAQSQTSRQAAPPGDAEAIEAIRVGIERGEFMVHYQPVVRLDDGAWVGVEALVRWQHPDRGVLPPAAFIDAAERSGIIVEVGRTVLAEAARQWRRWADDGVHLHVAVNLSGRQLTDPNLLTHVADAMGAVSMPPGVLQLEVTETSLIEDLRDATDVLTRLVDLGTEIAIDDFGTGWASLTYLREFPIQALKIDRVFVDGLGTNVSDTAIVNSIISLGSELGLSVIAEGIETVEQLDRLRRLGCRRGQGYHFARPMTADELARRIQ